MDIILCVFLAYLNGRLAKRKGYKSTPWLLSTMGAFFFTYFLGYMLPFMVNSNMPELTSTQEVVEYINNHLLIIFTMYAFGIGGYLFVRYILEKRPDISSNNEE